MEMNELAGYSGQVALYKIPVASALREHIECYSRTTSFILHVRSSLSFEYPYER